MCTISARQTTAAGPALAALGTSGAFVYSRPMVTLSPRLAQDIVTRTMRIIPFNQHCTFS